jgi:hypothetical protein
LLMVSHSIDTIDNQKREIDIFPFTEILRVKIAIFNKLKPDFVLMI